MYTLKFRRDKTCSCGENTKLFSPKGYNGVSCKCFMCIDCWIANEDKCNNCNENLSEWKTNIMKIGMCDICLLRKKLVKSPCQHSICLECWVETGKRKAECPYCRQNLTRWMCRLGIDIGSENMYDEDSLPTIQGGASIIDIFASMSVLNYVQDDEEEGEISEDEYDASTHERYPTGNMDNPYSWGNVCGGLFNCGCGQIVPIHQAASHCRGDEHIIWRDNL